MSDDAQQHGGKREGAGRPKGSLNKRSLAAIEALAERFPDWTPLMHLAEVANDETLDREIRLDAAKAAAPYVHPKPKGVELDPDALVDLESRIHAARLHAAADALAERPGLAGLAERLARAVDVRNHDTVGLVASMMPKVETDATATGADKLPGEEVPSEADPGVTRNATLPDPDPPKPPQPYASPIAWPEQPSSVSADYSPLED